MSRFRNGGKFRLPWALVAALLASALSLARASYLDRYAGSYTSCHGCFLLPALGHDAWLLSVLFVVLGLAVLAPRRWIRVVLCLSASLIITAQALDLLVLRLFTQRLYFADLLRFSGDASAEWSVARAQFFSGNGAAYAASAAGVIVVLIGLIVGTRRSRRHGLILLSGALGAAVFGIVMARSVTLRYVHDQYAWNVFGVNLPQGRTRTFSPAFAAHELQQNKRLPQTCARGGATGRNIVIVITESLSAYQSALLGGPHDWLPRLDAIARANHYFTHFYANGFTTDGGEISVITGRPPLIPPGQDEYSLAAFGPDPDTLPGIAHRAGYTAAHFTTESLKFLDTGTWLHRLDFDIVEGNESPFYAGMPRGQFGAAPDAALFARFEQWLDQRTDSRPFVSVLLTVSSHPPFVDPRSGKIDPAGSFGYVDVQLADFYAALDKRGFFANGILLITGDHHSMTPILAAEYRRFGARAFARIPLIVAGAIDMPKVVDASFQQSDFPASLAHILGVNYCRSAFNGIFLDPKPVPANYVVQTRGDNRDRVDVYFDDRATGYLEDGDASRWIGQERPPDAQTVAAWINTQRIRNTVVPAAGR